MQRTTMCCEMLWGDDTRSLLLFLVALLALLPSLLLWALLVTLALMPPPCMQVTQKPCADRIRLTEPSNEAQLLHLITSNMANVVHFESIPQRTNRHLRWLDFLTYCGFLFMTLTFLPTQTQSLIGVVFFLSVPCPWSLLHLLRFDLIAALVFQIIEIKRDLLRVKDLKRVSFSYV